VEFNEQSCFKNERREVRNDGQGQAKADGQGMQKENPEIKDAVFGKPGLLWAGHLRGCD
jgi:hypothetical protein